MLEGSALLAECLGAAAYGDIRNEMNDAITEKEWRGIEEQLEQRLPDYIQKRYEEAKESAGGELAEAKPFSLLSYCKIDNYRSKDLKDDHHYILEPQPIEKKMVFLRLMRQMQSQKLD